MADNEGQWKGFDGQWREKDRARTDERYNHESSNPYVPSQEVEAPPNQASVSDSTSSKIEELLNCLLKWAE